jgi:flavodoxin
MNTLVVYDSQYGNTERIAQAIADGLRADGLARAIRADSAQRIDLQDVDILVVGCPTQGWRPTPAMQSLLAKLPAERLQGVKVACFDTRFRKPRWLTGSAARVMARTLQARSIALLTPPESFFVEGKEGPLESGELERAAMWAYGLAKAAPAPEAVVA